MTKQDRIEYIEGKGWAIYVDGRHMTTMPNADEATARATLERMKANFSNPPSASDIQRKMRSDRGGF